MINTSGRMTALGVSTPRPEVVEAAMAGMNQYFEMKDLVNKTGEYIAKLLDVEGATVVSCASAGIAHTLPTRMTPSMRFCAQSILTLRGVIPHFSAISAVERYVCMLSPPPICGVAFLKGYRFLKIIIFP